MTITTKCEIGSQVKVKGLENAEGVCVSIWITTTGTQYEVVYWNSGKREKEYFFEHELLFD